MKRASNTVFAVLNKGDHPLSVKTFGIVDECFNSVNRSHSVTSSFQSGAAGDDRGGLFFR